MTFGIRARSLTKTYGRNRALDGVDLSVRAGTVLGVLGPNGAGKTTLVRVLATQLLPDSGQARVGPYDVVRDAHRVRGLTGLTGQYASVDEVLTGTENLVLLGRLLGLSRRAARQRAGELLARLELPEVADKPVRTYSGGLRRRLDLAAGLVGRPRVLFLDEPTTGLDPRGRSGLWDLIGELVTDGTTVLLTTQYLEEADLLCDDIAVIDHGRVVAAGTARELKERVGGQTLRVRPVHRVDLGTVRDVVAGLVSAHGGTAGPVQLAGDLVTGQVDDPAVLPEAVRRLDAAGVLIADLSLRQADLDEVFLTLTGRPAPASAEAEAEAPEGALR
ncbi:ATP-binding cassette domain-containing protein [Streptomyces boncukensis]|uniref:ABC-type xenobiotic transporter n=1 Tax=Streptomyces boncukensis TaxID=2711219 RepID=A0A6G4WYI1_9ACTN|nr:ATP-binding cassette domain-containing protein [Streptomyces boncukensis]NGO70346.1 ATP-binding cassette domain-containing protein [Streptomyces boncukensis]